LPEGAYSWDKAACELVIHNVPNKPFQLKAMTAIHPERQTDLEGLFYVGGVYATQVSLPVASGNGTSILRQHVLFVVHQLRQPLIAVANCKCSKFHVSIHV